MHLASVCPRAGHRPAAGTAAAVLLVPRPRGEDGSRTNESLCFQGPQVVFDIWWWTCGTPPRPQFPSPQSEGLVPGDLYGPLRLWDSDILRLEIAPRVLTARQRYSLRSIRTAGRGEEAWQVTEWALREQLEKGQTTEELVLMDP